MRTLNDILSKLKFDKEASPIEAHQQVLDLFAFAWELKNVSPEYAQLPNSELKMNNFRQPT